MVRPTRIHIAALVCGAIVLALAAMVAGLGIAAGLMALLGVAALAVIALSLFRREMRRRNRVP